MVFQQVPQQFKFFQGEIYTSPILPDFSAFHVYSQTFVMILFGLFLLFGPAQHCLDSGQKLHHTERFSDKIICTPFQSPDLVILRLFGGDHDYRDVLGIRPSFQIFQNCISVFSRKHNIQQYQIRHFLF